MQPVKLSVKDRIGDKSVHRIVLEELIVNGDPYEYFVGYAFDNTRLFEYKRETVNVHFV